MSGRTVMTRKLRRDLAARWGQVAAVSAVMACGIATFVMSLSMLDSLKATLDGFYARSRFADVFVRVERAPESVARRIAEIPGVTVVETRVVRRVMLDMPDLAEPASATVVSLPTDGRTGLNAVYLRSGRMPEGRHRRETLVSEAFAEAHGLRAGDPIRAVLNGRLEQLNIVGVALSPEFIYAIGPGGVLPDNERSGVLWMGREELAAAFDMEDAFNDAAIRLGSGASEAFVRDRVDAIADRWGGTGAYGRADQGSHRFVQNELHELRGMAVITPVIFLSVSAFLLNIVLARLIAAQRPQIATLRALGFGRARIGRHYLAYGLVIGTLSVVLGTALGTWMGRGLTDLYADFFAFPRFDYRVRREIVLIASAVGLGSAAIGVSLAVREAVLLVPAAAMQPEAPTGYRRSLLERFFLGSLLGPAGRMVVRQIERHPIKSGVSVLGIASATAIVVIGGSTGDAVRGLIDLQFGRIQRYDLDAVLVGRTDDSVVRAVRSIPGVTAAEGYRTIAAKIGVGPYGERIGLFGLSGDDGLFRMLDIRGRPVRLPEHGLVLSRSLADRLGVGAGDTVRLELLDGGRPVLTMRVDATLEDMTGSVGYMSLDSLNRLLGEPGVVGGVWIACEATARDRVVGVLRNAPRTATVQVKESTIQSFNATIERNLGLMRRFVIGFSMVIAYGVVYNSARVSFAERTRDLATMRVIGFSRSEVARVQLGELWLLLIAALPVGLALGCGLAWVVARSSRSEMFRIPFVVSRSSYAMAAAVVILAGVVTSVVLWQRVVRLDHLSALKARE